MAFSETLCPKLIYSAWQDTVATLQRWAQIVGKVRLALTPWLNHSWHVPLYVTARGLGTSPLPSRQEILEREFDFVAPRLVVRSSLGAVRDLGLAPRTVADFHRSLMGLLAELGI